MADCAACGMLQLYPNGYSEESRTLEDGGLDGHFHGESESGVEKTRPLQQTRQLAWRSGQLGSLTSHQQICVCELCSFNRARQRSAAVILLDATAWSIGVIHSFSIAGAGKHGSKALLRSTCFEHQPSSKSESNSRAHRQSHVAGTFVVMNPRSSHDHSFSRDSPAIFDEANVKTERPQASHLAASPRSAPARDDASRVFRWLRKLLSVGSAAASASIKATTQSPIIGLSLLADEATGFAS